ncbi:3-oxoacyl-[acyl-carrier-protein] reductase [Candidatus Margulisiibacteriota bacterium]
MNFDGKTAIVTGGSRGLGEGIALELARQGCNVFINFVSDSSKEKAEKVASQINGLGRKSQAFQVNVADYKAVKGMVDEIIKLEGKIDFLINNAGINKDKSFYLMSSEDWQKVIDINLTGTFNCSRAVIVPMLKAKYGKIINMSSVTGIIGMPGQANYGATKAGIIGFSKCLAKELAKHNIIVNVVAPGFIQTEMVDHLKPEYLAEMKKQIPSGRIGKVEEVAKTVAFLLTEEAAYITGHVIPIDGGIAI